MAAKKKVTEDPRGLKRICTSCGVRFYDLNKRPIICPSCETEFTGEIKVKTRRTRAAVVTEALEEEKAAKEKAANDEADSEEEADVDVVSLEDAAEGDDGADDDGEETADADLDLDALEDDADGDDLDGLEGDVDLNAAKTKDD